MFKRLLFENLGGLLPAAGFILTAFAFTLILIRALAMRKAEASRMARLPLSDAPTADHTATAECPTPSAENPSHPHVQAPR
jgi:hypothetical protein